ncbi:hypothetical protein CAQU_00570 [Corynebacterium aquilae DSM 44791]|uniref:tRNA-specific adenosine deaminase n=2 Tax=Corynebacterium aquilae TaxID=203263 RepID=A0A1L7CDB5_9CORY|nr:hypothetical protein CAQU_00570 [Corynebacterium aquilae DSM 44791]
MGRALDVARSTPARDVPVGAIILNADGEEIAAATNRRETDQDPTAHAEVLAIRQAVKNHHDGWRLGDCTLVVTLEPCAMCAGAILGARVGRLYFGAYEPKTGHVGSVHDTLRDPLALHRVETRGGIRQQECEKLLADFFSPLRGR